MVRTDRFKYVHAPGLPPVLHDLQADAVEAHNLAGSGSAFEREGLERLLEMRLRHEDETFSSIPG